MRKRKQFCLDMWDILDETHGAIGNHEMFMQHLFSPMYFTINAWIFTQVLYEEA